MIKRRSKRIFYWLLSSVLMLAAICCSSPQYVRADSMGNQPGYNSVAEKMLFGSPEELFAPITSISILDSAFGKEDGHDMMYTTCGGYPAVFNVIDLTEYKTVRSYNITGGTGGMNVWAHKVDSNGMVYFGMIYSGKDADLYVYSPVDKTVKVAATIPGESFIWCLQCDEQNNIYIGTYPGGKVFKYISSTGELKDFGVIVGGSSSQKYLRSMSYYNNYLYAGTGNEKGQVIKIDPVTGENLGVVWEMSAPGMIYSLDIVEGFMFLQVEYSSSDRRLTIYDLNENRVLENVVDIKNYSGLHLPPVRDGKVYLSVNGGLRYFDIATKTLVNLVQPSSKFNTFIRGGDWVELPAQFGLPSLSLVTIANNGSILAVNLSGNTYTFQRLPAIAHPTEANIQSLEKGPDGRLYMGGYLSGDTGAIYETSSGKKVNVYKLPQTEGMGYLGETMYMGTYPTANIYTIDTSTINMDKVYSTTNTPVKMLFQVGEHQDRPFVITSGEGKLFIGTIAGYGDVQGALTVYDPNSNEVPKYKVYKNIVENQSITGLAYKDGKIYGSTTVYGGLGLDPLASEAVLFVWDAASRQKEFEFKLDIPGFTNPKMIGGLSFGPDGLLWGCTDGLVFAIDPDTCKVVKSRNIYPTITDYGRWRPAYLRWDSGGLLYTTLGGNLTVIDPATLDYITLKNNVSLMVLDDGGDIYYADNTKLWTIKTYSLEHINDMLDGYLEKDEMDNALYSQLTNSLEQAQSFLGKNKSDQALKHFDDFLKHINNDAMTERISENAKITLNSYVNEIIEKIRQ